ncbi:MAG: extensin family protein [Sandaracinaceae bacterium]|nr:extensin family protein [Sandaracinaceae bacterium]
MALWATVSLVACAGPSTAPNELPNPSGSVAVRGPADAGLLTDSAVVTDAEVDVDASGPLEPSLSIAPVASPHPMDEVDGHDWAAVIPLDVTVVGVTRVEYFVGAVYAGSSDSAPHGFDAVFSTPGVRTLVAVGLDADGEEVARDEVTVEVTASTDSSCHAMLTALGLDWSVTTPRQGIADPVRVEPVINGVSFRYVSNTAPTALIMDCTLGPRLYQLTEIIKPLGMDEVIHIGIYNYRCIGGLPLSDPDCVLSKHSFGRAIDLYGFGLAGSTTEYTLLDDWNITSGATCPGAPTGAADTALHTIACAMWSEGAFQTILTPNYNADHRNHFHVDTGGSFIKDRHGEQLLPGIDPLGGLHEH